MSHLLTSLRNYIAHLLEQLTVDYKNIKEKRKKLSFLFPDTGEDFTILEGIELLTVDIRGYASQIQARGWIENEREAIDRLQSQQVFDILAIAHFYFTADGEFERMKAYIRMLDYLRLLILDYLRSHPSSEL